MEEPPKPPPLDPERQGEIATLIENFGVSAAAASEAWSATNLSEISALTDNLGAGFAAAVSEACVGTNTSAVPADWAVASVTLTDSELSALQERINADHIAMEEALPSKKDYWLDLCSVR